MKDGTPHTNFTTGPHLDVKCIQGGVELNVRLSSEEFARLFGDAVADRISSLEEENASLREQHLKDTERVLAAADTISSLQREKDQLRVRIDQLEEQLDREGACAAEPTEPPFTYAINPDLFPDAPTVWACRLWDALLLIAGESDSKGRPLISNGSHIAAVFLALRSLRSLRYKFSANREWFISGWNANVAARIADPRRRAALSIAPGTLRSAISRSPLRGVEPAVWRLKALEGDAASQRAFTAGAEIFSRMEGWDGFLQR